MWEHSHDIRRKMRHSYNEEAAMHYVLIILI